MRWFNGLETYRTIPASSAGGILVTHADAAAGEEDADAQAHADGGGAEAGGEMEFVARVAISL